MKIRNHTEINGVTARYLRDQSGLSQEKFWRAVGVNQTTGSHYEKGNRRVMETVQKLIFVHYVAGFAFDSSTLAGADAMRAAAARAKQE